jgi:two-component sensor histidine kinase
VEVMSKETDIPHLNLRWLLQASLVGLLFGAPISLIFFSHSYSLKSIFISGVIGVIFSVIMWGGSILGWRLMIRLPNQGTPGWIALRSYLGWGAGFVICVGLAGGLIRLVVGINIFNRYSIGIGTLAGLSISGLMMGYRFLKEEIRLSRELGLVEARSQSLALRAQLSPHTLFNSLNTITALIPEQPGKAEEAVQHLSRLLRHILSALEQEHWTLGDEFALLKDLLEMEHLRFGERLNYVMEINEEEAARLVPPLMLLPLVENSLKHGFRPKVGTCLLKIRAEAGYVRITDDGVGRAPSAEEGVGLRNVRQRLEALGGSLRWIEVPQGCSLEVRLCP